MKTKHLLPVLLSLVIALSSLQGRVVVQTVEQAVNKASFNRGSLESNLKHGLEEVTAAVEEAVGELGFEEVSRQVDMMGGQFVFRTAENEEVTVSAFFMTDSFTQLQIRVGKRGDQDVSNAMFERIDARLRG